MPAAGPQHAEGLVERVLDAGDVPDAEGDRVGVEARVREGQRHRVADDPVEPRRRRSAASARRRPRLSMSSVMSRTVAWPSPLDAPQEAEGDVAGAAGDVEQRHAGPRRQPVEHRVLPQPVDAEAHRVVHQVVARGDRARRRRARGPAFSASGTVSKPKWVVGSSAMHASALSVVSAAPYKAGRAGCNRARARRSTRCRSCPRSRRCAAASSRC